VATTSEAQGEPEDDQACAEEPEVGPLRRCAVTRERLAKERMIRFVIGPERQVVPDLAATLPGRGIWLSARGDVIEAAISRGVFAKAARGPASVPPDLTSVLQASLARRIGESLGLARRAGQAVSGFQKAREWLDAGRAGVVVEASDGSIPERDRFLGRHAGKVTLVTPLDGDAMGAIFGRDQAVHVVVARGRLACRIGQDAERLAGVRMRSPPGDKQAGAKQAGLKADGRARKRAAREQQDPPAPPDGVNSRIQAGK
jgi:predicted RNA-binding protein YlxR (DUF448 family)